MRFSEKNIILTSDGTHTVKSRFFDETYHSINGARQESEHVFLNAGFRALHKNSLNILEIGFGTGLNAILSFRESGLSGKKVYYHAIELYPLSVNTVKELNYTQFLSGEEKEKFKKMHDVGWNDSVELSPLFTLHKEKIDLLVFETAKQFDCIYFDAFSPNVQPELWCRSVFEKLYNTLSDEGVMVTYSVKGMVKRNMAKAGFDIEKLPGPPGKRHILRGKKISYR